MIEIKDEPDGATPLDPDELDGLKLQHITTRGQLNELEQTNIQSGLSWLARRRKFDVLDDESLRRLHEKLFGDVWRWAGTYRKTEKNIGIDPRDIAVQSRILLGDARYWFEHKTFDPLEAAARFHHRLVQIHLFPNGNGRHARIAADLYLEDYHKHDPIDWAAGFDLQNGNARRDAYIKALRSADAGDLALLLAFVNAKR